MSTVEELIRLAKEAVENDQDDQGPVLKPGEPRLPLDARATQVVTCRPKHHASGRCFQDGLEGTGFSVRRPVSLKQCSYGINKAVCLMLTVADVQDFKVKWSQTASLNLIVEDANGWRAVLSVFHGSPRFFEERPVFCIMDPRLRKKKDGSVVIRVDSPLDVHDIKPREFSSAILMETEYRRRLNNVLLLDMEELREKGIEFHARGDYSRALRCWTQALLLSPGSTVESRRITALCRLNRAAVYLKLQRPKLAELDCRLIALYGMSDVLSPLQTEKLWFRRITAQYEAGMSLAKVEPAEIQRQEKRDRLIRRWKAREEAADEGDYDWKAMLHAAQKSERFDLDEYPPSLRSSTDINKSGLVELVSIPGKGRGLIAARNIEATELIFLSKPLAFAGPPTAKGRRRDLQTVNLVTESIEAPSRAELIRQIYEDVIEDERLHLGIEQLYAGPAYGFHRTNQHANPQDFMMQGADMEDSVDAGKVEGVVTHNSFRVRCASKLFESEKEQQNPASALYLHPSMLNHSCLANCSYIAFGRVLVVRAMIDIAKGQELTISYCDPCANLVDRRRALRHHFGPRQVCTCPLCDADAAGDYEGRKHLHESCGQLDDADQQRVEKLLVSAQALYKFRGPLGGLRPELYPVFRRLARLSGTLKQRCSMELQAANCLAPPPSEVGEQVPVIPCQPLVMSLLLIGSMMLEGDDGASVHQSTLARRMHDAAARHHHALCGPGLLKMRLGEWMTGESLRWLGTGRFEDA